MLDNKSGRALHTNQELRDFEKKNPNMHIVSPQSDQWRNHVDRVKNLAEDRAVKRGFRDFRHSAESKRDARNKKLNEKIQPKG